MILRALFPLCVQPSVRKGVLPSMLEEILETRIMVKQSMKSYKQDKALMRLLHARQLGLKLIANVTFGYTAANYSGRMPSVEVGEPELGAGCGRGRGRWFHLCEADVSVEFKTTGTCLASDPTCVFLLQVGDSIVHKARETLERAIKMVNDTKKWGARVVYGDTDRLASPNATLFFYFTCSPLIYIRPAQHILHPQTAVTTSCNSLYMQRSDVNSNNDPCVLVT